MQTLVNNAIYKSGNTLLLLLGAFLCSFMFYFLLTGFDEIWYEGSIWLYGIRIAGLLLSIGSACITFSLNPKSRTWHFLKISTAFSIAIILLSIYQW